MLVSGRVGFVLGIWAVHVVKKVGIANLIGLWGCMAFRPFRVIERGVFGWMLTGSVFFSYGCWTKNRGKTPKMDGLQWNTLLKWMIWGAHPYFWKHPYLCGKDVITKVREWYFWWLGCDLRPDLGPSNMKSSTKCPMHITFYFCQMGSPC